MALYRPALLRAAEACGVQPDEPALARSGEILARHNTRIYPRTVEIGAGRIFSEVFASWDLAQLEQLTAAIEAFFGFFQQRLVSYPESVAVLDGLRQAGFHTGILTDVPYGMPRTFVESDLRAAGLESKVDILLTSVEVGSRKPAPAGFSALAQALGVQTSELCYVGNEQKDITGALAVGAVAVLVDRESRRPGWSQTHTIRDLSELRGLLS